MDPSSPRHSPRSRTGGAAFLQAAIAAVTWTATLLLAAPSSAQQIRDDLWVTDGPVNAVATANNQLYLGGSFTRVGPLLGHAAVLDANGIAVAPYSRADGRVNVAIADASGGWYLGGRFDTVGGLARANLAHIDASGNVTAWNPGPNFEIFALARSGSTIYVGGDFSTIGGQNRSCLAAVDGVTGTATGWDPNVGGAVYTIVVTGGAVYTGGYYTTAGGQPRNYAAAFDAGTGALTGWNPNADERVMALSVWVGTVYAGGHFTQIGGQPRSRLAALDLSAGTANGWNPNASDAVFALRVTQLAAIPNTITVYAAGLFTQIGGQARSFIGAVDGVTGSATSWNPSASQPVNALSVRVNNITGAATTIYAGGSFFNIGGQPRNRIAALNGSGVATSWNPKANGEVRAVAYNGNVFAGGDFTAIGGLSRNNLAALDLATGAATGWDPNSDGTVNALVTSGTTVYAGGVFATVGGQARARLAAIDAATGSATSWIADTFPLPGGNPHVVNALALRGGVLYVGGEFYLVGGQLRNNIGAVDTLTGAATSWNANSNGPVLALATTQRIVFPNIVTVYAGGQFTQIGGQARHQLASLDDAGGAATGWDPNSIGDVHAIALATSNITGNATTIFVGGDFTSVGGQTRNRIAALAPAGTATSWNPNANGSVRALLLRGPSIFAGGNFSILGGLSRVGIAALDATGTPTSWHPTLQGSVEDLVVVDDQVYAGGAFTTALGTPPRNIAGFFDGFTAVDETAITANSDRILASPNPSRGGVVLSFSLTRAGMADVGVYDLAGRIVRRIHDGGLPAGAGQLRWDGRDDSGSLVDPGLYFVRAEGAGSLRSAKVLRLR